MKLHILNSLGREKQEFKPIEPGKVSFYFCGPTVYWTQHIGNLRSAQSADLVVRVLKYFGYQVTMASNYTDVGHLTSDSDEGEDKMEKAVRREGYNPAVIAQKYIDAYERDYQELNIVRPDHVCRATDYVQEMIEMIQVLLDKGFAYVTPLAIYFNISKVKDYTKLSGQNLEKNIAHAGTGEVNDNEKKNHADFALWFFRAGVHAEALQYWSSPFSSPLVEAGVGFPGWHIECSAMSKKHLGNSIDIHMGGIEHVSVHHTNEIAQSESANGVKFVNYWLHNEHLLVNNGKMSKSDGTSYILPDIKARGYTPMHLRYLYLQAHYRSKLNFTWESLDAARTGLDSIYRSLKNLGTEIGLIDLDLQEKFSEALADDFNTPRALAVMQEVLKDEMRDADKLATLLDFDRVLALNFAEAISGDVEIDSDTMKLKILRDEARINKNWAESDRLRAEIESHGYEIEDSKEGTKLIKK